jgi:hypothetical protein
MKSFVSIVMIDFAYSLNLRRNSANSRSEQALCSSRDMALAHQGMGITEADWTRFIEIAMSVAGELGVGPPEGGEVMAFLDSLKADIVTT